VIVGFSGGSDSVALLFILHRLGYKCIAAHANFHLRGDESVQDELFCKSFTEQHLIPFEKIEFDTPWYAAKHQISIEMAARELRYNWFDTLREKYDAQAIAVAHHRDDSNETVLLNMIRGTGIRGLCGIRPRNGFVVRPLLCVSKDDITGFLHANNLPFVTDSSNKSDEFSRNHVRMNLIPMMKKINPSAELALTRMTTHLTAVEGIYQQAIENAKNKVMHKSEDDTYIISITELLRLSYAKTILYELIHPFGFTRQLSDRIYQSLSRQSGKMFNATGTNYQLLKDRETLLIYQKMDNTTPLYQIDENRTSFENQSIRLDFRKIAITDAFIMDKSSSTASFDDEKIHFPLFLRRWRAGDWFVPFGMKGRKKLSDYFSDHQFSLLQKNKMWLLCSEKDVIWIVGERIDNRYRINENTKCALIINFFSKNSCDK